MLPRGGGEVKAEDGVGGGGAVDGEGAGVEERAADDVEVGPEGEGGEVAAAVELGVGGSRGEGAPGEMAGVEEVGAGDGGVLVEDADEGGEAAVDLARRE